jgi:hypothetical protein
LTAATVGGAAAAIKTSLSDSAMQSSARRAQSAGERSPGRPKRPEGEAEEKEEEAEKEEVDENVDENTDDDGLGARCRRALSASARLKKAVILRLR